jgi:glycosyltransferase involved in cell wall biosynthesis
VIIPVYRGEKYVAEAIGSALAQTYRNVEIVIVDDGSPDRSEQRIAPFLRHPNVRYVKQPNRGVASARNQGIRASRGALVAFLDQDDVWLPDKLERQVAALRQNPGDALVHGYQAYIDGRGNRIAYPADWVRSVHGSCFENLFLENRIAVLTVVVRRQVLDVVGPFNEDIPGTDDYELWLRIARRFRIGFIHGAPLACYRVHDANASRDHFRMELGEFKAISSIVDQFPDMRRMLGKQVVDRRLSELHLSLGGWYAWIARDRRTARRHLMRAARYRPFQVKAYRRLLWHCLTDGQRRSITWYRRRLEMLMSRSAP